MSSGKKITKVGLKKNVGKRVRIEREGIKGNFLEMDGTIKEGALLGILCEDESGFYVDMFRTHWSKEKLEIDEKHFLTEAYRVQNRDSINLLAPRGVESYLVNL